MEFLAPFELPGLFLAAFLAATILPASSEALLVLLLVNGGSPVALIMVATLGNTLGSLANYALGLWAGLPLARRWLGVSDNQVNTANRIFTRYGLPSLLFAWLPIVGDALTIIAGALRVHLMWFTLLVGLGKLVRYLVVAGATLSWV
ncbi:MAG: YqaA family protein [Pseudomonadota bacterium]